MNPGNSKSKLYYQVLIGASVIVLLLVIVFSKSVYDNQRFAGREIQGIEEIRTLLLALHEIQKYRGIEQVLLNREPGPTPQVHRTIQHQRTEALRKIQHHLEKFPRDDFRVAKDLGLVYDQLKQHTDLDFTSPLRHFAYHSEQIELIISIIQRIHHESNLILDSQYDSYYLESICVTRMTAMIENLAKIRGWTSGYVLRGKINDEYHHKIEQEIVLLENSVGEIRLRLGYLVKEVPVIGNLFNDPMEKILAEVKEYALYTSKALNNRPNGESPESTFARGSVVIDNAVSLQMKMLDQVSIIIRERIRKNFGRGVLMGGSLLITLAILLWITSFYIGQNRKLSRLFLAITEGRAHLIYGNTPSEIYLNLCKILVEHGGYLAVGIFLMKHNKTKDLQPVAIYGSASGYLENIRVSWGDNELGDGPGGRSVKTGQPQIFNNILKDPGFAPWRNKARSYGIKSNASIPLIYENEKIGTIALYSHKRNTFLSDEIDMIQKLMEDTMFNIAAIKTRQERDNALKKLYSHNVLLKKKVQEKTRTIVETQDATILSLASLVESRDNETGNHVLRTKEYIRVLLDILKELPEFKDELYTEKIEEIYKSSPLHDIGKIAIADSILRKPGKLTRKEFDAMKQHTVIGASAIEKAARGIAATAFLDTAKEIILYHHEKWNGSGYPSGLKGREIPLSARIMTVADVYDALISKRVYKKALTHDEAVSIIQAASAKDFDPHVVEAFLEAADEFKKIARLFAD